MNELKENGMLYDTNEMVKQLNRVEGFEPKDYLREEKNEDGISYYLDTKYRLLWFRLKFPQGKLVKIPKTLNKDYATFEVRVYADRNDAEENFLANGFASRYKDDANEKFGLNFVESAETAALGRALKDAGFGTQFCDIALPDDQTVVDAGVHISFDTGEETVANSDEGEVPTEEAGSTVTAAKSVTEEKKALETKPELKPKEEKKLVLTAEMPVEELLEKMTVDFAKTIIVDYGFDKGKSLGRLEQERPQAVQYHASKAQNNLIRAGAIFLLEYNKKVRGGIYDA